MGDQRKPAPLLVLPATRLGGQALAPPVLWATHSRLQPVIDAAKTLKRHEAGLLSYFKHRITNATAEGLNSRIQAIRVAGRGYRNRDNLKTAIYFHLGGLQLYPPTRGTPG